jgi:hypothetical protein
MRMNGDHQQRLMAIHGSDNRMHGRLGPKVFLAGLDKSNGPLSRGQKALQCRG